MNWIEGLMNREYKRAEKLKEEISSLTFYVPEDEPPFLSEHPEEAQLMQQKKAELESIRDAINHLERLVTICNILF